MTAAEAIRARAGAARFDAAIILGTGLGAVVDRIERPIAIPYSDLPGFPKPGVSGHVGRLVVGEIAGARVAFLQGRAHVYETGDPRAMAGVVAMLASHGTGALLITNAAGSLRAAMPPGSLMAISDHIGLFCPNPLIGETGDDRFLAMNDAYDPDLRAHLKAAGEAAGVPLAAGVYAYVTGPSFETPAEIRALAALGADAVGMSTVPEVILARRAGLKVAGLSLITNMAAGLAPHAPSHKETKETAAAGAEDFAALLVAFLARLAP